ncbi:MAG: hypothetical protein JJU36_01605 [Phycisphaeraceae bacterium]|nr:hypothetical protein [Phycisphaeraceae bacterium]
MTSALLCTTRKEVEAWAVEHDLADTVDYTSIDPRLAGVINAVVFESIRDFPKIRPLLKYLGCVRGHARRRRELVGRSRAELAASSGPLRRSSPKFRPIRFAIAWVSTNDPFLTGLCLASNAWRSVGPYWDRSLFCQDTVPVGSLTKAWEIGYHECAHLIDQVYGISRQLLPMRLAAETPKASMRTEISAYAGKNRLEFVAECWAEFKTRAFPRRYARTVADFILAHAERPADASDRYSTTTDVPIATVTPSQMVPQPA